MCELFDYDNEYENIILNDKNDEINEQDKMYKSENDIFRCLFCNYTTFRKNNYNRHLLSLKHNLKNKYQKTYKCTICQYECSKISLLNTHYSTKKHLYNISKNDVSNNELSIETLSNDKLSNVEEFKSEVITTLMTQLDSVLKDNKHILAEQTKMMIEQHKMNEMINDLSNKPSNSITNHTNNQSFNLNMFLNETCKDAMNISDFIAGMDVTIEDMELTGTMGFAKAMNHIIMKNLNAIDVCKRPIHCSDVKRETMYYKHNGVWERDTDDKKKTKELIYNLSFVNWKRLMDWRFLPRNKGYDLSDHYKNDEFTKLVMEVNTVDMNEINKVITYLCRDVAIDKAKFRAGGYRKKNL